MLKSFGPIKEFFAVFAFLHIIGGIEFLMISIFDSKIKPAAIGYCFSSILLGVIFLIIYKQILKTVEEK